MTSPTVLVILVPLVLALVAFAAFLTYIWVRYSPIVRRVFEEPPVFAPLRVAPETGGESVRFPTRDGLELAGTYFPTTAPARLGVIVFCPEFLGDRWSALAYADGLREAGFDLFTFDFRNHGDSANDPTYAPLQWVSDRELIDLRAALAYLRTRPDRDPAGVGLFGLSRGGGTALVVAADDPTIWGIATDGAFPTHGTMLAYVLRWAEIYVGRPDLWHRMPRALFAFAGWTGRVSSQRRSGRWYPSLERCVARLSPRPWLLIHGERDAYIGPEIAMELFRNSRGPKQAWIVAGAKHNRCREADPALYRERLTGFFRQWAPRSGEPSPATPPAPTVNDREPRESVVAVPAAP